MAWPTGGGDVQPHRASNFLAIGHVARDLRPGGRRLGGAVTYAAMTARGLGMRPALVTSAGPDVVIGSEVLGIPAHVIPAAVTTTFHNSYIGGQRRQALRSVAGSIKPHDVPPCWRSAPMVLLGPLAGEVSHKLARHFPRSIVVASIQGWLRRWDTTGLVAPKSWEGRNVLPYVHAAVVSIEDVGDERLIDRWAELTPVLIVTLGGEGAKLHARGVWRKIEPFPVREVDPTGAGDVFAAAFLVRYSETRNPVDAARFASCAASFCVEIEGLDGIPTRVQVEERLDQRK